MRVAKAARICGHPAILNCRQAVAAECELPARLAKARGPGYSPEVEGGSAMRTSRPARLTGGGPIWDLRTPKRAADRPARTSPLPEADAAMALNDAITSAVAALGKGDVAQARAMKRRAWEYIALLHPAQTVRQRRTLGMLGRRIAQAERIGRSHQDGPAIQASSDRTQAELDATVNERSEERRVGKECRSRWSPYH